MSDKTWLQRFHALYKVIIEEFKYAEKCLGARISEFILFGGSSQSE